ncbi:MAG: tRNA (adenosine(37)-N6)-threonylcarbamoyltransferase complex dimerization subunit type 1 TsaB [Chloroflexi bacterium]|nr:tRNA (adenosine(37)-N6)-threonylcarbamoyltransferase complex dimerization subunit type 1 TsaB [Chloroflexota bacterium]
MLLAIDTSTSTISLALHDGNQVRVEHTWESPRRHTVELIPTLANSLQQLECSARDLAGIAIATGPGSFTGLRAGMAVAKSLALARSLPLAGIPTLDIVAAAQEEEDRFLCAVLQAGRGRICAATYRWRGKMWTATEEPELTTWPALIENTIHPTTFCGEIDQTGKDALASLGDLAVVTPGAARLRRAGYLAELGWRRLKQNKVDDPATLTPVYLHYPVR